MNYPTLLPAAVLLAVVGLFTMVGHGKRKARKAAHTARQAVHTVSVSGRVLVAAAVIVGGQFAVIRYGHNNLALLLAALSLPALLAAVPLVRALTLTTTARKGARR